MDLELETGPVILDLSVSANGRFAGAIVSRDLIVYDLRDKTIAAVRTGDAAPQCVHFANNATIFLCEPSGRILTFSVEDLSPVNLP
jgi:hypothetical protein